jgi:hypothetical protein
MILTLAGCWNWQGGSERGIDLIQDGNRNLVRVMGVHVKLPETGLHLDY